MSDIGEVRVLYWFGQCCLIPSIRRVFFGLLVDTEQQCFEIPLEKIEVFALLREGMLKSDFCQVKTLQRWVGKIISFMLAVPAAKKNRQIPAAAAATAQTSVRWRRTINLTSA